MDGIMILVFGVATFANIVVIYIKLKHNQVQNAIVDFAVLAILAYVFGSTVSGLAIATITSALFSIYLFFDPPQINLPTRTRGKKRNWRHSTNL